MNLQHLVHEMRQKANQIPFHPGVDDVLQFRRDISIDGYAIKITLTRTVVGRRQFYQLSMGNDEGDPALLPPALVEKLKAAFVPKAMSFPSFVGNCLQFLEPI
jgi:hypothetical protein